MSYFASKHFTKASLLLIFVLMTSCSSNTKKDDAQKRSDLYYAHGTSKLVKKNYTDALGLLIKAHKIDPKSSKINNNLGMAYFFKGKHKKAISHIKTAITNDPTNSDAKINLASVMYRLGKYGEAKIQYKNVLEDLVYRHQYRTHYNLALIAMKEGNSNQAISHLQKSLKERNDYCPAHFKLGKIYRLQNQNTKALNSFKEASLGNCIKNPAPIYEQAVTYEKMGDFQKAKSKYQAIVELNGKSNYANLAKIKLRNLNAKKIPTPLVLKDKRKKYNSKYTDLELEKDLETYETPNF